MTSSCAHGHAGVPVFLAGGVLLLEKVLPALPDDDCCAQTAKILDRGDALRVTWRHEERGTHINIVHEVDLFAPFFVVGHSTDYQLALLSVECGDNRVEYRVNPLNLEPQSPRKILADVNIESDARDSVFREVLSRRVRRINTRLELAVVCNGLGAAMAPSPSVAG